MFPKLGSRFQGLIDGYTDMSNGPVRSESDLLAFISSVMREELYYARKVVVETCKATDFTRPWAFEYTPGSSEPPDQGYLRKVREADFVFWLIGEETTQPVVDEITTSVTAGRRLLAFKLPSGTRCGVTRNLMSQVAGYAKWADVKDNDDLAQHVREALSDELIRAIRDPEPPNRPLKLMEMNGFRYPDANACGLHSAYKKKWLPSLPNISLLEIFWNSLSLECSEL